MSAANQDIVLSYVVVTSSNLRSEGNSNKLICRDLKLSEGTVKVHVSAILKALHVHSRTEAIAALARRGISVDTLSARRASVESTLR